MEPSQVPTEYVRTSLGSSTPQIRLPSHHNDGRRVAFDRDESLGNLDNDSFDAQ